MQQANRAFRVVLALLWLAAPACTVKDTTAPALSGPSTFALALSITANPDAISRDGGSQSAITVIARDASGNPVNGQTVRLSTDVDGSPASLGTLSASTVVTDSTGTAHATFTAPPASPPGTAIPTCGGVVGQCISIIAAPSGTNISGTQNLSQSVVVRLVPLGTITPPSAIPVAKFTFSPSAPTAGASMIFDASTSCPSQLDSSGACPNTGTGGMIVSYHWTFGDGSTGTGVSPSHTYTGSGNFSATLTVTNDSGLASLPTTVSIPVGAGVIPTGSFTFSPTTPNRGDLVQFNADTIVPAAGHVIVTQNWNFGDPTSSSNTASGLVVTHTFASAGIYTVVLSVADDTGLRAQFTQTVTVGTGNPIAVLTLSNGAGAHEIQANGSASTAVGSAVITRYDFNWGDGTADTSGGASVVSHTYAAGLAGTSVTVTLTVTDNATPPRSGTTSQSIVVP